MTSSVRYFDIFGIQGKNSEHNFVVAILVIFTSAGSIIFRYFLMAHISVNNKPRDFKLLSNKILLQLYFSLDFYLTILQHFYRTLYLDQYL